MLLTTTPQIEGKQITEYLGLVTAEVVYGAHFGRDLLAGLRDFFGGRSRSYETVLQEAKKEALKELQERAQAMGADAVVGVAFEFGTAGGTGSMLVLHVVGTAVKCK